MSETKLEAHEAEFRKPAMELLERAANWQSPTGGSFLELAKLLKELQRTLWEAGYGERLLQIQSEVLGRYDTPAYYATIHLAQTDHVADERLAECLEQDCVRCVKPKSGWPKKPRMLPLKQVVDVEFLNGMQVHWLRMKRELLGCGHLEPAMPTPPTSLQQSIWDALDGRALKVDDLAAICVVERRQLYANGGLPEMKEAGAVQYKRNVGYYRPDARPPMLVPKSVPN